MPYDVRGGRVVTWSLECHAVDHCNLRCAHCCTLSPALPARRVTPAELARDLALASRALRVATFKLTGGEPLLHPELPELARVARASGIAERVQLTTNGLLARSAPEDLWPALDQVTVSVYPSAPLPGSVLRHLRDACTRHGVELTEKRADAFQVMDCRPPRDDAHARLVHATCWLRHRCHLIRDGRFYACTRPPSLGLVLGAGRGGEDDGVGLDQPDLARHLLAYLESEEPLRACRACLGATGRFETHRQAPPGASATA